MIANKRETRLARLLRDQLRSDSANMNADHLLDETVIRVLDPKMVCRKCGHVGANVRSDWGPHVTSGTSSSCPLGVSERVLPSQRRSRRPPPNGPAIAWRSP